MRTPDATTSFSRRWLPLFAAAALVLSAGTSRAAVVLTLQSVTATAGSTGNTLDVTLLNTGPASITVGSFSFEITIASANIQFTDATTATVLASYIFNIGGSHSAFGPSIATNTPLAPGAPLDASDNYSPFGSGQVVASGGTVGLGHVVFNVAPATAPGPYTVSFNTDPAFTSLSNASGNATFPITTFTPGVITVIGATAVPEPSPLVLAGVALLAGLGYRRVRRTQA